MKSQFAHLEMWTAAGTNRGDKQRWSARDILKEMAREPGACGHVEQPETPIQLLGIKPMELADEIDSIAPKLKDSLGRSQQNRARVLCAAVFSYPIPRSEADSRDEEKWAGDTLQFARRFFGHDNIKSAVAHTDEKYFHLHIAIVPPLRGSRLAWEEVHPGLAAEHGIRQISGDKKEARKQYFNALRTFQDRYFNEVSVKHGQSRTGPERRRLTRKEWKTEERVTRLIEKAAGKSMPELLAAAHWQQKFERVEKEKAAALARAEAAERSAAKLRRQVVRLLRKLKKYVLSRVRILQKDVPDFAPVVVREREKVDEFQGVQMVPIVERVHNRKREVVR